MSSTHPDILVLSEFAGWTPNGFRGVWEWGQPLAS
jgi:hypothetical protein